MAGEGGWDEAGAAGFGDKRLKNTLPVYANKDSMNINSMILTNIIGSPYFKEELINYKTFHEVVDEIYYKVDHLEPWEKNSRKLAGQVGMCAGVRGVAAGGIVSTAFCLLFKLFTFKLTRKQLTAMLNHRDSPYIRGIGFIYIRYCQPPADFWDWFSPYLDDEEEIDLKAGGGYSVTVGEMCQMMISKLDWFGTLFPRLPVNVQKVLEAKLKEVKIASMAARAEQMEVNARNGEQVEVEQGGQSAGRDNRDNWGEAGRRALEESHASQRRSPNNRIRQRSRSGERRRSRSRDRRISPRVRDRSRDRRRSRSKERRRRSRSLEKRRRSHSVEKRRRSRSRERRRSRSHSRDRVRRVHRSHSRDRRSRSRERRRSRDRRAAGRSSRRRSHSRERRR